MAAVLRAAPGRRFRSMRTFDVMVVGGRPDGEEAAARPSDRGTSVAVVGEVPLKRLRHAVLPSRHAASCGCHCSSRPGSDARERSVRSWSVKPPRRLQDLSQSTDRARRELRAATGREPTIAELANRLGRSRGEVTGAVLASRA
jgi:RNA polymerase sigma-B factor